MADQLWKGAQRDLMVQVAGASVDACVWDHSSRVARIAQTLATIPELRDRSIDVPSLVAAGLYHDAGWVIQVRAGEVNVRELLLKPTTDMQREMAAEWVIEQVAQLVPAATALQAAKIIRQMNHRRTENVEARILADAENLDEIGPPSVCLMARKVIAEGKTLSDLLALWDRQKEYKYWPARIKDGFHFEPSRRIATARLAKLSHFMEDLRQVVQLDDIKALGLNVPESPALEAR